MHIGITTFGCDSGKSGISQYVIKLLKSFARADTGDTFEVLVYEDERDIFVKNHNRLATLAAGRTPRKPVADILWHQLSLPGLCKRRKYDVLFLPAANRRVPFRSPCPMVGTVHDFSWLHMAGKYDKLRTIYLTKVLPKLIGRLTDVITVSESSKRDVLDNTSVPDDRVAVIHNGVDHDVFFARDKEDACRRMCAKYHVREPYILYISRIEHPGKNHVRLIRAFEQLKARADVPHQLVLAGGDFLGAEEVHRCAENSSASNNIVFTGFADAEDLPDLCAGADLFVYPSLYEGFGIPVLEAMACGTPVVCSNVASLPEVVDEAALLFDPYDETAIAEAMRKIVADQAARDRYSQLGLKHAREFSWECAARETLHVLHRAAGR